MVRILARKLVSAITLGLLIFPSCERVVLGNDYEVQAVGPFGGLNNIDNPMTIPSDKAQDLLNVDITPGGKSVKKREGYAQAFQLTIASSAGHGIYNFYESGGSDVSLFFNDRRMASSIGGGAITNLISTGTLGATYQCTDSQGFAYCANTARNFIIKTNGASFTLVGNVNSTGTMVTVTPERLVMAGFSEAPNRIDFSKGSDFNTWVVDGTPTGPNQLTIVSPGAKITHITYAHGRVYWFKDSSFGYVLFGPTLADWKVVTLSQNLGTLDNTTVYWNDVLYFRGQDAHIYAFDGAGLEKLTRDIGTTIAAAQTRRANNWIQTTAVDFAAGSQSPAGWGDLVTVSGSLKNKTTDFVQTTQGQWDNGAVSGNTQFVDTVTVSGNLQTLWPDQFDSFRDGSGGSMTAWTKWAGGGDTSKISATTSAGILSLTNSDGLEFRGIRSSLLGDFRAGTTFFVRLDTQTFGTDLELWISSTPNTTNATGENGFIVGISQQKLMYVKAGTTTLVDICESGPCNTFTFPLDLYVSLTTTTYQISNTTFGVVSTGLHKWTNTQNVYANLMNLEGPAKIDRFGYSPMQFSHTSESHDTGITTPYWDVFSTSVTGGGAVISQTEVSADNSSFDSPVTVSSGNRTASLNKRYIRVKSNFTQNIASSTPLAVGDFSQPAFSSGTFYSAVKNAPNITAWDSFGATKQEIGGSHQFYIRGQNSSFLLTDVSPTWTAISAGAVPSISTFSFFQIRDDFNATESSHTLTLDDFTVNWFEGQAGDKAYASYHNDAVWWSVASGTGASANNYILRYDLITPGWTLYDIPTNGMLVRNLHLYFIGASTGVVYRFGDVDNDNGSAINSYWKSKDFFLDSPFTDKDFVNMSVSAGSVANSSATLTYTINGSSSTSYTIPLYRDTASFLRNNKNLPQGKTGSTINVRFGNNAADQPFEIFGVQFGYRRKSWIPN